MWRIRAISATIILALLGLLAFGIWGTLNSHYWTISGKVDFTQEEGSPVDFVAELEAFENQNSDSLYYKNIELTGKGTEVKYVMRFTAPPIGNSPSSVFLESQDWTSVPIGLSIGFLIFFGIPMAWYAINPNSWRN
jgi:hypothetical protein